MGLFSGLFTPTPVPTPPISFQQQKAMENYYAPRSTPNNFFYSGTNPETIARVDQMNKTGSYIPPTTKTPSPKPTGEVMGLSDVNNGPSIADQLQSGYNDYYSQLDQMLAGLTGQQTNLQNVAQEQTNQQMSNLDLQRTQGVDTLNQYQNKSLKNIGETIASGMRAGNNLLGSMGAGDSSAANQYAYALAKEGSKQRGGVMADVSARLGGLQQVYNTAKNNLVSGLNQRINEIAQWFSEQQNSIRGMKATAAKQYSDQALQIALGQLQTAQQDVMNQRNALDTWVANNATSIQQATQLMQQNAQNLPIPTMNTMFSSGSSTAPTYYNNSNTTEKSPTLFNNNLSWLT